MAALLRPSSSRIFRSNPSTANSPSFADTTRRLSPRRGAGIIAANTAPIALSEPEQRLVPSGGAVGHVQDRFNALDPARGSQFRDETGHAAAANRNDDPHAGFYVELLGYFVGKRLFQGRGYDDLRKRPALVHFRSITCSKAEKQSQLGATISGF